MTGETDRRAGDDLEWVACDLCGRDDAEPFIVLPDRLMRTTGHCFQLVHCRNCGLLYLNPRPTVESLSRYYPDEYAPFSRPRLSSWMRRRSDRRDIRTLWPLLAPPRRVLDVGSATGELLHVIRASGNPRLLGVEPSPFAASIARDRRGLDVRTGTLESNCLADESFDTALLSHVLEHLPSPSGTLAELRRVLKPHGALILWLPNADSLAARAQRSYWMGFDAPRHLYDFAPSTLCRLLEEQGFAVRSIEHEWIGLEWSWALRLWVSDRLERAAVNRLLAQIHPALTAFLTPISFGAALVGRAGRLRVVAIRRPR